MPTFTSIPKFTGVVNAPYEYAVATVPKCLLSDSNGFLLLDSSGLYIDTTPCDINSAWREITIVTAPPWLFLIVVDINAGTALLTGTPVLNGVFSVELLVTDSSGYTDTQSFNIEVNTPYESLVPDEIILNWLAQNQQALLLLRIQSSAGEKFLSTGKYTSKPLDSPAHQPFMPLIADWPYFETRIDDPWAEPDPAWGDIRIRNNGMMDDWNALGFDGREFTWLMGNEEWALSDFEQIATGRVANTGIRVVDGGHYSLAVGDMLAALDTPFYNAGGLPFENYHFTEGPSEGEIIPICFGRCFNIRPVLASLNPLCYRFNRGASFALHAARDNGQPLTDYHVDLANSLFYPHSQPVGDITLDVSGYLTGTGYYLRTPGEFVWLCLATAGVISAGQPLDGADDLDALLPYELGMYITDDISCRELLTKIRKSLGCAVGVRRDGIPYTRSLDFRDTPDHVLNAGDVPHQAYEFVDKMMPLKQVTVNYRTNWTPQSNFTGYVSEVQPDLADTYRKEFSQVTVVNPAVPAKHITSEGYELDTLIYNSTEAQALGQRVLDFRSSMIDVIELPIQDQRISLIELGDTVQIPWLQRFGLADSIMLVAGIKNSVSGRGVLTLWRKQT